jgi:hypothetical protein
MKNIRTLWFAVLAMTASVGLSTRATTAAADWLSLPSTYTHSPASGERVAQYMPVEAPPIVDQSRRITSGYTHFRSTIQVGQSADNYHRVDEWGPPVRPYDEWRFPYRPYSVPYSEWGAPFAGLNLGFGFPGAFYPPGGGHPGGGHLGNGYPGGGYPGNGYPGGGIPGQPNPYPSNPGAGYPVPPWWDGNWPDTSYQRPLSDREFFRSPTDRN